MMILESQHSRAYSVIHLTLHGFSKEKAFAVVTVHVTLLW